MWHPVIRVLALLLLAVAVPSLPLLDLLALTLLLLLLLQRRGALSVGMRALRRVRWLLLGIVLMFGLFTRGEPLIESFPVPSEEGLAEGLRRGLALGVLVLAVALLMAATARMEVAAALAWLLRPLRLAGWDAERFARRLSLTLEATQRAPLELPPTRVGAAEAALEAIAARALEIEREAHSPAAAESRLPVLAAPPRWQWALVLAAALLAALVPR